MDRRLSRYDSDFSRQQLALDAEPANRGIEQKQHVMIIEELEVETASLNEAQTKISQAARCATPPRMYYNSCSRCLKGLSGRIRHSPELV